MITQTHSSLLLASTYRVSDVDQMWREVTSQTELLRQLRVRHVVVYTSSWDPRRVMVTVALRPDRPTQDFVRSPTLRTWFAAAGADELPAVFLGEIAQKITVRPDSETTLPDGVVIGAITAVTDVPRLMAEIDREKSRFDIAGVRRVWVYQAIDNHQEVLILQDCENLRNAQHWVDHPDKAAEWMSRAGIGVYPKVFIGTLTHRLTVPSGTYGEH